MWLRGQTSYGNTLAVVTKYVGGITTRPRRGHGRVGGNGIAYCQVIDVTTF